jgi:hypothetical protein
VGRAHRFSVCYFRSAHTGPGGAFCPGVLANLNLVFENSTPRLGHPSGPKAGIRGVPFSTNSRMPRRRTIGPCPSEGERWCRKTQDCALPDHELDAPTRPVLGDKASCDALELPNEPPRSFTVLEHSIDRAGRRRDRKFKPLILGQIQAAGDRRVHIALGEQVSGLVLVAQEAHGRGVAFAEHNVSDRAEACGVVGDLAAVP